MHPKLTRGLPETERFTPDILLATYPKLSLIIDLTNTSRYYNKQEFTSKSVHYEKIYVPGKECPTSDLVHRFFEIVDKFVDSEDNADSLIGVHCTHGVNRTGYFICRYMIQRLGFDPVTALEAFQEGRGYPIERKNYIRDLKKCSINEVEHAKKSSVKANNPHKTVDKKNVYRTASICSSRGSVNKNSSYTTAETNNSYRGSYTNTSWRNEKRQNDDILYSRQGYKINRNYQEERKYKHISCSGEHTTSGSNYNRGHTTSVNSKSSSLRGREHRYLPSYGFNHYGGDSSYSDQSDWRANNPYTQRNVVGPVRRDQ